MGLYMGLGIIFLLSRSGFI